MTSAGIMYSSDQPRQLVMRKDGHCYIFRTTSTINTDNASDFEEQPVSRTYQYRKVMKPMLERKRRARINRCLEELKELMLTALQSEGENVSKLEKADILELTVRHLHNLKRQKILKISVDGDCFLAGFTHCATEVSQYLGIFLQSRNCGIPSKGVELSSNQSSGEKLLQHLQSCIQRIETAVNQCDNTANLYSTPPSSLLPDTTYFHSIKRGSNYVSSLERSVWRPW